MGKVLIKIGKVVEVENKFSKNYANGLRVRAKLDIDKQKQKINELIPWAFPLLPKSLQITPKVGESVFIIADETDGFASGQRYYIGPIISQPQYNTFCSYDDSTTLLQSSGRNPMPAIEWNSDTNGSFPENEDVALVGRGSEDVILKYDRDSSTSEVDIRAGIRSKAGTFDKDIIGNVIFNGTDPAYIQLKYKKGIATGAGTSSNSLINIVANRINIMSNKDPEINHDLRDNKTLVKEERMNDIMNSLHQVPKGDKLVELLELMKGAILHHVHPWAGMEQCGDKPGFINQLKDYDMQKILSEYVRIS